MAAALASFAALASINYCARSLGTLAVGALLQGVPCGMLANLATTYAADVCPPTVADTVTGCINASWVIGQVLSAGVLWSVVNDGSEMSIRIPMSLQWFFPPLVIVVCCLAPESPWYLARRGRYDAALDALGRLSQYDAAARLAEIQELVGAEQEMRVGGTYLDCFRGSNRARTEIAVMCSAGQLLAGFAITSQVVYFMQLAGLDSRDSFKMAFCGLPRDRHLTRGSLLTRRHSQLARPPRRQRRVLRRPPPPGSPRRVHGGPCGHGAGTLRHRTVGGAGADARRRRRRSGVLGPSQSRLRLVCGLWFVAAALRRGRRD